MTKEELEKEAREYAEGMAMYYESAHGSIPSQFEKYLRNAYISSSKPREKRIAELEKENAELKDYRLTTVAKQQTDMSKYALNLEHKLSWYDNQLTKAKEIINDLVHLGEFNEDTDEEYFNYQVHEALKNAEQFLDSEVEK